MEPRELTAFVLAGGKSTRMGSDKAFIEYAGGTLLARALDLAHSIADAVQIVGNQEKFARFGNTVEDRFRDHGPLGGIHAALRASRTEYNLMLAIDMPFVSAELLQYLSLQAQATQAIVTVPRVGGRFQPLCAVYRRGFARFAEEALRERRNKIGLLLESAETRVIGEEELQRAGFSTGLFRNLNTPEELQAARQGLSDLI
jgi:molybdopterin-guanine dinucleotide biosynthesis protein A